MFDSYIILNRKPHIIIVIFIYIFIIFLLYLFYFLNTYTFTLYYSNTSFIKYVDGDYYLMIDAELKDSDLILKGEEIYLNDKLYKYQIYRIDEGINDTQVIYLKIFNIEEDYKIDNFAIKIKIFDRKVKLINYL